MSRDILLEICCGSVDDAIEAGQGGADRVELNSSMFLGGLTPSMGSVIEAKKQIAIPVMVMIRPRSGGFCYTDAEYQVMLHDTRLALESGADGIVFGILCADGIVDIDRCRSVVDLVKASGKEVVFHRAFDVLPDPFEAMEQLVELGIDRILTSGQERSVPEGIPLLKKLIETAADRIQILPGGGIKPHNAAWIIEQTGATMVHMAAFKSMSDSSCRHHPSITFGGCLYPPENRYDLIDQDAVRKMRNECNR